jgi:hypothetical protein
MDGSDGGRQCGRTDGEAVSYDDAGWGNTEEADKCVFPMRAYSDKQMPSLSKSVRA